MSTGLFNSLRIYEHTLELLKTYSHLLSKKLPKNCTEADYLSLVWNRYFELLFESTCVRVKRGESTADHSNDNTKELYSGEEHVISFKIDIRFLVDYNMKECDVACEKVAKHDGEKKIIGDEGKLCREAKDIVGQYSDFWN
ncbi:hypothetical protein HPULCUR_004340 [Helicostylum pulchrum]|uniref:Uncharacterized protein n=1 Tax=Helicostylum pulchrum TaxID=562976 RepID=A0ABP9XVX9_9FUNG